jgi:tRNA isopentenyl-2-thiomethyl-A-37 hydroxylase MiaE
VPLLVSLLPPQDRVPFFVHVDEFQTFSSDAFASLLSEARKFALHFAVANQYTDQLSNAVRASVIGNAGTLLIFRVGSRDAELLVPEFRPMDPGALADALGAAAPIREQSRQRFGRSRAVTERQRQLRF